MLTFANIGQFLIVVKHAVVLLLFVFDVFIYDCSKECYFCRFFSLCGLIFLLIFAILVLYFSNDSVVP